MRFEISFTIGTFESAADAYQLLKAHIKGPLKVIKSAIAFNEGNPIMQAGDILKSLGSDKEDWFSLHAGELSEITEYPVSYLLFAIMELCFSPFFIK
jgi:hypothetical protein